MTKQAIVIGLGQLGSVFAEGLLRTGVPVVPVLRHTPREEWAAQDADLCVLAVGEDDLAKAAATLPTHLHSRAVLLQNELRPLTVGQVGLPGATLCIVWFEKKAGKVLTEVRPSVVSGPQAQAVATLLAQVGVQARVVAGQEETAHALVLKNLYILGLNLSGLLARVRTGTKLVAGDLLGDAEFDALVEELIALERRALHAAGENSSAPSGGAPVLDESRLRTELRQAIEADRGHGCAGRSAPARLTRTLHLAAELGQEVPVLQQLAKEVADRG